MSKKKGLVLTTVIIVIIQEAPCVSTSFIEVALRSVTLSAVLNRHSQSPSEARSNEYHRKQFVKPSVLIQRDKNIFWCRKTSTQYILERWNERFSLLYCEKQNFCLSFDAFWRYFNIRNI